MQRASLHVLTRGMIIAAIWATTASGRSVQAAAIFYSYVAASAGTQEQSRKDFDEEYSENASVSSVAATYAFEDAAELGFVGDASAVATFLFGVETPTLGLYSEARMQTGGDIIASTATAYGE